MPCEFTATQPYSEQVWLIVNKTTWCGNITSNAPVSHILGTWLGVLSFEGLPRLTIRLSDEYLHGWSSLLPNVPRATVRHFFPHQVHVHLDDTWISYRYHLEGMQGFWNTTLPLSLSLSLSPPLQGPRSYKEFWSYCGGLILMSTQTGTTPNFTPDHSPDSSDILQF